MKRKPDILVVLAALLGVGIAVSSVGNTNVKPDKKPQLTQTAQINQYHK